MEENKEENKQEQAPQSQENTGTPRGRNWVTDLYDRANISVRQLDIALVALGLLIIVLFVIFGK